MIAVSLEMSDEPTLWAWEQSEEIIPVRTHRRKYYRLADVERLAALHPISK